MSRPTTTYATLDNWILHETIPFSIDSSETFNASIDKVITLLDDSVKLLGFGEALHGGEDILILRNRLFQRLAETHGYSAIAIESSFPRARVVNEYIAGRGPASYETVQDTGFSHDFGRLDANRELVEWMRQYNADPSHRVKLQFYGFDSPTEMTSTDSPRVQAGSCILFSITSPRLIVPAAKSIASASIRFLARKLIGRTPLQ